VSVVCVYSRAHRASTARYMRLWRYTGPDIDYHSQELGVDVGGAVGAKGGEVRCSSGTEDSPLYVAHSNPAFFGSDPRVSDP
jgi:hypothetical protein